MSFSKQISYKRVLEFETDSLFCSLDDPHFHRFKRYAEKLSDEMKRRCLTPAGCDLQMYTVWFNRHYYNQ